jgi:hypothetical protein
VSIEPVLAGAHHQPGATLAVARRDLQQVADRRKCGVDQADVRVGLREVAEQLAPVAGSMSSENRPSGLHLVRDHAVEHRRRRRRGAPASASASAHQKLQIVNALVVSPKSSAFGSAA